ncbi:lipocalin-like domain-containing protein [Streptomyces nanshensis]|uniref:Lipocalin-like domain-containing protein n=1 Tax=Streptomyces nanshensis TaxID=518642 RepID=A0A1E7L265_9ACTN|nr:lipocalin-like domain-containing protein [Streptomyces nanshensis]OEV10280.1 hypothetical protein AN218_18245 [Streptomyces nanshensis]
MTTSRADEVRELLLGAWRLVSWEVTEADGTVSRPLGEHPLGQLLYDRGGRMSAQLVWAHRPLPDGEDWRQASQEEMTGSWPGYFGYFGTFTVDGDTGTVTHHVESGSFPGLTGTDQVRDHHLEGRRLTLGAVTAWGRVRIVWERYEYE